ncbi:PREDICTED: uncharacterized protein LOC106899621 [Calidris pugnax]|uniref:uncharacterized protein LOC106899621 n=1 Tax=Calidris pugnax TaxID=198806 RepID=UPI00071E2808|nr:PREDICTED: uncharacterized protein LOC106899621 [Calidris pugnax]
MPGEGGSNRSVRRTTESRRETGPRPHSGSARRHSNLPHSLRYCRLLRAVGGRARQYSRFFKDEKRETGYRARIARRARRHKCGGGAGCLDRCAAATAGSAGVDLATAIVTTLITSEKLCLGLGQARAIIKASPTPRSLIHFSLLLLLGNQVHLQARDLSCYNQCQPCQPCGPTPLATSCNEPCVRQCQNSTVVIQPSPVVVALPGPILSSFPQNTLVGSSTSAAVGSILSCDGVPITSGCCDLSGISNCYYGRRC